MIRIALVAVLAGVLAGCGGSGGSLDCGEQNALAETLAADAVFGRFPAAAEPGGVERSWPCRRQDNSAEASSAVIAMQEYELTAPMSFDEIAELVEPVPDPVDWENIGHVRPEWGGTGWQAMFCYRSTARDVHRYLTVETTDPARFAGPPRPAFRYLLVSVFQTETKQEQCWTTGRPVQPAGASNGPG